MMLMGLFSSFDSMVFMFPISMFIFLKSLSFNSWKFSKISLLIWGEDMPVRAKAVSIILASLLVMIAMLNFSSVFGFLFPLTSQLSVVYFLSFSIWFALFFFNMVRNMKGFFSHMVPAGCPLLLSIFLYLIEWVSCLIRPLTLCIRLVANILAGHVLMVLLSNMSLHSLLGSSAYLLLNGVEVFVAFIQAYIFVTMMSLYYSDLE